jgi:putative oxidoreductase
VNRWIDLTARLAIAQIFMLAGINQISGYAGSQAYLQSAGVPGNLLPLVIALELGAGAALVVGWQCRLAAATLALFSIATALLFHGHLADEMQSLLFLKDIAIAGGLALLAIHGAGALSLDARRRA